MPTRRVKRKSYLAAGPSGLREVIVTGLAKSGSGWKPPLRVIPKLPSSLWIFTVVTLVLTLLWTEKIKTFENSAKLKY